MSQNYLIIGAPGDAMMGENSGMVYIYELDADGGEFEVDFDASFMPGMDTMGARFGTSVAVYEGTGDIFVPEDPLQGWAAVGAPGLNLTGSVFIYTKNEDDEDDDWALASQVWPPISESPIDFGASVSWYSDVLVSDSA